MTKPVASNNARCVLKEASRILPILLNSQAEPSLFSSETTILPERNDATSSDFSSGWQTPVGFGPDIRTSLASPRLTPQKAEYVPMG